MVEAVNSEGTGNRRSRGDRRGEQQWTEQTETQSATRQSSAIRHISYWAEKIQQQVEAWNTLIDRYFAWVETLAEAPTDMLLYARTGRARMGRRRCADRALPADVGQGSWFAGLTALMAALERPGSTNDLGETGAGVAGQPGDAHRPRAMVRRGKTGAGAEDARPHAALADGMNMRFLYAAERKRVFHRLQRGRQAAGQLLLRPAGERSAVGQFRGGGAGRGSRGTLVCAWDGRLPPRTGSAPCSRGAARCSST